VAGNIATASGTTTVTIDGKIPLMSTSAPLEDATGVSTGLTKLTFTFNENIAIADGTIVTITDDNNSNNYQEITLSSSGQRQQADHQPEQRAHQRHLLYRDRRHRHRPGRQCRHHRRYAAAALHHRGHYAGGSAPDAPVLEYVDTAPAWDTDSTRPPTTMASPATTASASPAPR
jgi:hypothetical protein